MPRRGKRTEESVARGMERLDQISESLRDQGRLLNAQSDLLRAQTEILLGLREEIRAQTMALFRLIDRLGPAEAG